jgi:hypothetical protein
METDKYFPNLGSAINACADAFGWPEICSPYSCHPSFSAPPSGLLHWRLCAFSNVREPSHATTRPCDRDQSRNWTISCSDQRWRFVCISRRRRIAGRQPNISEPASALSRSPPSGSAAEAVADPSAEPTRQHRRLHRNVGCRNAYDQAAMVEYLQAHPVSP